VILRRAKGGEPREPGQLIEKADAIGKKIAPAKHDPDPPGPNIITHERVLGNITVPTPFGTFNVNPSELHQIRPQKGGGVELIQVVDPDGSTGLETVFWRFPLIKGWRIELQGPGVYTKGARFFGIGFTKDAIDEKAHEAASITVELKLTEADVARLASLAGPGVAAAVSESISATASSGVAAIVGHALAGAVPVVSALIALSTAHWAYKTLKDPDASTTDKTLAVAHAISDAVRIVLPMVGTVANVALVGISLGLKWWQRKRQQAEQAATQQTGPPPAPPALDEVPA
jgi:hypothetical protein